MPSICLLYGSGVALGGFGGKSSVRNRRWKTRAFLAGGPVRAQRLARTRVFLSSIGVSREVRWGIRSVIRSRLPIVRGGLDALVVRVQLRLEQNQRGQAAGDVGDFADFLGGQRAAQQAVLAVA